jgi:ribosomal protein S18 acetylase RimI-like enzyme
MPLQDIHMRLQSLLRGNGNTLPRAWAYTAAESGRAVGFGQLSRWGTRGEICNLIVSEAWRGQGIGSAMIRRLIGVARENSLADVEIGAALSNPRALALYRRLGFADDRRVMLDLGKGAEPVIYLLMDFGRGICEA